MPERRPGEWPGFRVYRWATPACEVVAVPSGMGYAHAAASAHMLAWHFSPQTLISFGFAGGLDPELGQGTVVIGEQLVADEAPELRYHPPPALIETWYAAASAEQLPVQRGTIVTVKRAVADPWSKVALARRTGACAVDMETAGVAEAARQAGLPCVAVRAVVDTATESLPTACLDLMRQDGRVEGRSLLRACWQSPGLLRDLFWLGRHAATARRHLDRTIKRWAMDREERGGA
jgi:adenosylhomocysteine nucleosidase